MARKFPEKISREFRSFWISKMRTIQKIGGKSNLGRKLEIAFPKISVHLAGCPLFRKFRKVLFRSPSKILHVGAVGRMERILGFPASAHALTVLFAVPKWRYLRRTRSYWSGRWGIFRWKFSLPLLTWTFPQNHRSVVSRIASPGFPRIRWCQTQLNGQSPS